MSDPVLVTQNCKHKCGMKVETLLRPGHTIPEPRECVKCQRRPSPNTDPLADILDVCTHWTRPMSDEERIAEIRKIAMAAWLAKFK